MATEDFISCAVCSHDDVAGESGVALVASPTGAAGQAKGGISLEIALLGDPSLRLNCGCAQDDATTKGRGRVVSLDFGRGLTTDD